MPGKPAGFQDANLRFQRLRRRMEALLWDPELAKKPWGHRVGVRALQIAYAVGRDLVEGQLSLRAMSLVYYTVIATIPLLALTFSVLKGLGAHNAMEPALLNLLAPLGERSAEVTRNVINFVENVRVDVLSFVSLGVLLYTVLNMMQKIEMSFNFIWSVAEGRRFANRVSEYLFAIIVSPLLLFLSIGITSYINTNIFERTLGNVVFGGVLLQILGSITAFMFMSLAFAFAYSFIPNTRVRFASALVGGVMTTIIWKTMGKIFQSFFASGSPNEIVYVAFFTVILVMIFAYLGWLVLLTGSSIAYYHQYPSRARTGRRTARLSLQDEEELTLTVVLLIVQRFQRQQTPWSAGELASHLHINPLIVDEILKTLCGLCFIRPTNEEPQRYLPSGAIDHCTVVALRDSIRRYRPDTIDEGSPIHARQQIQTFLSDADRVLDGKLGDLRFLDLVANADKPAPARLAHTDDDPTNDGHKDA